MVLIGIGVLLIGISLLVTAVLNVAVMLVLADLYKMYKPFMKKMFKSLEDEA